MIKFCPKCRRTLQATEEFFFPSYLKPGGKNECKSCHKERNHGVSSLSYHARLKAKALPISGEQVTLYRSFNSIATAIGTTKTVIEHDIFDQGLPVYSFIYNKVGPALALRVEDAENYVREQRASRQSVQDDVTPVPAPAVTQAQNDVIGREGVCGCCGSEKGNILAVHNNERRTVAYLCSPCYRAAKSFAWEPTRLRAVAQIIEAVGGDVDRSRR